MHSDTRAPSLITRDPSDERQETSDGFTLLEIKRQSCLHHLWQGFLTGFTMTEMVVVIVMISLFVLMVQMNLFGLLRKSTFKAQVQDLISTMQMAANAAAESNRRYELTIDPVEQKYVLREITSADLSQVLEEEIIVENDLSDNCRVVYVEFDDGESVNDGWAKFRVGHSGWQYGGKIVLLDTQERPYSIVVNRLNRTVSLAEGDVGLLEPKTKEEVPF
jgi:Tfp pilus assembly protein FimT